MASRENLNDTIQNSRSNYAVATNLTKRVQTQNYSRTWLIQPKTNTICGTTPCLTFRLRLPTCDLN